jgi:hypothetical protein
MKENNRALQWDMLKHLLFNISSTTIVVKIQNPAERIKLLQILENIEFPDD